MTNTTTIPEININPQDMYITLEALRLSKNTFPEQHYVAFATLLQKVSKYVGEFDEYLKVLQLQQKENVLEETSEVAEPKE